MPARPGNALRSTRYFTRFFFASSRACCASGDFAPCTATTCWNAAFASAFFFK